MEIKLLKKNGTKNSGFTIMETLVAIFIILLSITGPMVFVQNGLRTAFLARDQITAFFLAQDAIEFIKNIRDGRALEIVNKENPIATATDWDDWLTGLDECTKSAGCTVDTTTSEIRSCSTNNTIGCLNDTNPADYTSLKIDSNGIFGFDGTSDSIFAREIKITPIPDYAGNKNEADVVVTIRWKSHEGVGIREIKVKENIFNWAEGLANQ